MLVLALQRCLHDIVAPTLPYSRKKFHCHLVKSIACISQLQAFSCELELCKSYGWSGINVIIPTFALTTATYM